MTAHLVETPPALSVEEFGSLAMPLSTAIHRALEKDPAKRFVSATDFAAALGATPEGAAGSGQPTRVANGQLATTMRTPNNPRSRTRRPRRGWLRAVLLAALIGLLGLGAFGTQLSAQVAGLAAVSATQSPPLAPTATARLSSAPTTAITAATVLPAPTQPVQTSSPSQAPAASQAVASTPRPALATIAPIVNSAAPTTVGSVTGRILYGEAPLTNVTYELREWLDDPANRRLYGAGATGTDGSWLVAGVPSGAHVVLFITTPTGFFPPQPLLPPQVAGSMATVSTNQTLSLGDLRLERMLNVAIPARGSSTFFWSSIPNVVTYCITLFDRSFGTYLANKSCGPLQAPAWTAPSLVPGHLYELTLQAYAYANLSGYFWEIGSTRSSGDYGGFSFPGAQEFTAP